MPTGSKPGVNSWSPSPSKEKLHGVKGEEIGLSRHRNADEKHQRKQEEGPPRHHQPAITTDMVVMLPPSTVWSSTRSAEPPPRAGRECLWKNRKQKGNSRSATLQDS